jgi:hypothetical protein
MAETKLSCFWHGPDLGRDTRAAVSPHGHTNGSKKSLQRLPELARTGAILGSDGTAEAVPFPTRSPFNPFAVPNPYEGRSGSEECRFYE